MPYCPDCLLAKSLVVPFQDPSRVQWAHLRLQPTEVSLRVSQHVGLSRIRAPQNLVVDHHLPYWNPHIKFVVSWYLPFLDKSMWNGMFKATKQNAAESSHLLRETGCKALERPAPLHPPLLSPTQPRCGWQCQDSTLEGSKPSVERHKETGNGKAMNMGHSTARIYAVWSKPARALYSSASQGSFDYQVYPSDFRLLSMYCVCQTLLHLCLFQQCNVWAHAHTLHV